MAIHSSILAWRIPWTEEPGRLQSMGRKESDTIKRLTHTHRVAGSNRKEEFQEMRPEVFLGRMQIVGLSKEIHFTLNKVGVLGGF